MDGDSEKSEEIEVAGEESPEITLRPLGLSDIDDFMVWATDERVSRFCVWEPYKSKEDGEKYIKERVGPHPWFRAICVDDRAVGMISVTPNSGMEKCRGQIGYALGYKWWGKGIVTKAVKAVSKSVFEEWPHLERLEAFTDVENRGSQRVLEKAGFRREGVLRKYVVLKGRTWDLAIYSLLSSDLRKLSSHHLHPST